MNKKDLFYTITMVFIFLLVVNVFGILSTNDKCVSSFLFSSNQIEKLLSVFVSCLSILLTGYFAVLAIEAYGKIRAIKRDAEDAKKYRNSAYSSLRDMGNASITIYQTAINLTEMANSFNDGDEKTRNLIIKRREDFTRDLYRLGLIQYMLDEETRIRFISNLTNFAEEKDWEKLKEISKSEKESKEVKRILREILDLKNKQKSSDALEENPSFCNRLKTAWKILCNTEQ